MNINKYFQCLCDTLAYLIKKILRYANLLNIKFSIQFIYKHKSKHMH